MQQRVLSESVMQRWGASGLYVPLQLLYTNHVEVASTDISIKDRSADSIRMNAKFLLRDSKAITVFSGLEWQRSMKILIHHGIFIHMNGETTCSAGSVGMIDGIHRDNNVA